LQNSSYSKGFRYLIISYRAVVKVAGY